MGGPSPSPKVDADGDTLIASDEPSTHVSRSSASSSGPGPVASERQLLAGRYEILALVGSGGMGTVYRARDVELDEVVALKVMRPELVETPGILERFRREAKLARRVTHRNVARVYDIGEHEHDKFLTMEFVDGESLSAALAREGALSIGRAVAVAAAIAEGLGSAHAAGVVHRDLKPDNVLLAKDGRVVITDFGIARALVDAMGGPPGRPEAPRGQADTLGLFVGTPAYMAPEQVKQIAEIGPRTDIYAFGALLYELFTGQRAWPGDAPLGVATARLLAPPPDPRALRRDLPDALAELVLRCLAKDPADRPASMGEVLAALAMPHDAASTTSRRGATRTMLESGATAPLPRASAEKTVAVLPFVNAGAPDDAFLAEELTDDLLDALSMTRGLKVRARGAVLRYRGVDIDPREIGRELGVQVVVEGSVRRARGHVRISARLVSVADGFQVWAKRFDRPEQDVLSINDEAARAIAEALTLDGRAVAERSAPSNPVAVDLYLRARHEHRQFGVDHQRRAVDLFDQALAIAPEDPLLMAGTAMALARLSFFDGNHAIPRARQVAERAVLLAPHLGEAHLALGSVLFQVGEVAGAARALRAAVTCSPGLAEAHGALGRLLCEVGAVDDGLHRLETAYSLDPDAPLVLGDLARVYALLGRWIDSDRMHEHLSPADGFAYWTMRARTLLWRDDRAKLEAELATMPKVPELKYPHLLREIARTKTLPPEVEELERTERVGGMRRHAFVFQIGAELLSYVGRHEEALASVARAVDLGLIDMLWMERCPLLAPLRQTPRYREVHDQLARRTNVILEAYRAG